MSNVPREGFDKVRRPRKKKEFMIPSPFFSLKNRERENLKKRYHCKNFRTPLLYSFKNLYTEIPLNIQFLITFQECGNDHGTIASRATTCTGNQMQLFPSFKTTIPNHFIR